MSGNDAAQGHPLAGAIISALRLPFGWEPFKFLKHYGCDGICLICHK